MTSIISYANVAQLLFLLPLLLILTFPPSLLRILSLWRWFQVGTCFCLLIFTFLTPWMAKWHSWEGRLGIFLRYSHHTSWNILPTFCQALFSRNFPRDLFHKWTLLYLTSPFLCCLQICSHIIWLTGFTFKNSNYFSKYISLLQHLTYISLFIIDVSVKLVVLGEKKLISCWDHFLQIVESHSLQIVESHSFLMAE